MDDKTRREILEENIKLHRIEAAHYEALHPEEFNWFEQKQMNDDLEFIRSRIPGNCLALDLGCGTGCLALKLLRLGCDVRGVDISEDMLRILKKRVPPEAQDRISLTSGSVDEFIASCSDRFDLIVMSSFLHHLPDYLRTLKNTVGLLRPGGWIYITHEPAKNALAPDRFLRKILWQVDNVVYGIFKLGRRPRVSPRSYRMSDYQLYHGFDEEAVISCCKGEGLTIVKFNRYSSAMRLGVSCWIDSKLLNSKGQFSLITRR